MTENKRSSRQSNLVRPGEEPEDALWRNVVAQAVADATNPLPERAGPFRDQMELIRGQARAWVERQRRDFRDVCELAGLEASRVRTFILDRIREANERDRVRILEILKGSTPGVVAENAECQGDRRPQAPQKTEEIEFSQNGDFAP